MTLITPVPHWWASFTRSIGNFNMWFVKNVTDSWYPFDQLTRLSFIHFANWSTFDRIPANHPNGHPLDHAYLLFQANFDRGSDEYIEGFTYAVPLAMRLNWGGAYHFPPPQPVTRFLEYVNARFTRPPVHSYCAYPGASTRMILAALHTRRRFNELAGEGHRPPPDFRPTVKPPLDAAPGGVPTGRVRTISVLCPIRANRLDELESVLTELPTGLDSPLAKVTGTHMARWSIVPSLPGKDEDEPAGETAYLLFASWYDGATADYLCSLKLLPGDVAGDVWGNCVGYPHEGTMGEFSAYLDRHRVKPHLAFHGYNESVTEVRAALELRDRLSDCVDPLSGLDSAELEDAWLEQAIKRGIARRPAQRQAAAGAVERSARCREAEEGRRPRGADRSAVGGNRGVAGAGTAIRRETRRQSRARSLRCCAVPRGPPSTKWRAQWAGSGTRSAGSSREP